MTTTTTSPMTNLYDVLDVEPSSSPDEIRAAWRTAVAELDPTDRRFRVYNQAAEVLLDARRRASYDEEFEHVATGPSELPRSSRASSLRSRSGRSAAAPPRRDVLTRAWLIVALAAATAVVLGYVGVALTQPVGRLGGDRHRRCAGGRRTGRSSRSSPTTPATWPGARRERPP